MNVERATDEPNRSRARAIPLQRCLPCLHHRRLIAEAQVVVGRKDDDLAPAFHLHARPLGAGEVVELLVHAIGPELVQFGRDALIEACAHAPISRITLPAWPSLIT